MRNTLETRLGIFVALALVAAVLLFETVGGLELFRGGKRMYALFSTVQDLKVGDRVKMAGVDVGRVEDIKLREDVNKVSVAMKINRGAEVRTDSTAMIRFTGLMGQNFVSLDFGTPGSPIAEPNFTLPSREQPDFNTIMAKLENVATGVENLTKSFTGEDIHNLLGPFTDFIKANQIPLTVSIANLRNISTQMAEGKGTVGKLINDDSLYNSALASARELETAAGEIKTTLTDARKIVDQASTMVADINAGHGTIGKLLRDEKVYDETAASMTNLREILQKINQGQGSVGKLLNDKEFYNNAKMTLQKLDKATEGLEDQGPLSVMGILVNNLL